MPPGAKSVLYNLRSVKKCHVHAQIEKSTQLCAVSKIAVERKCNALLTPGDIKCGQKITAVPGGVGSKRWPSSSVRRAAQSKRWNPLLGVILFLPSGNSTAAVRPSWPTPRPRAGRSSAARAARGKAPRSADTSAQVLDERLSSAYYFHPKLLLGPSFCNFGVILHKNYSKIMQI